jgi:hypothetical protein
LAFQVNALNFPFGKADTYNDTISTSGDTVSFTVDDLVNWITINVDTSGSVSITNSEDRIGSLVYIQAISDAGSSDVLTFLDINGLSTYTIAASDTVIITAIWDGSYYRYLSPEASDLTISNDLDVTGDLNVDGVADVDSINVSDDVIIQTDLDVDGATTLDAVTIAEGVTLSSTLDVDGVSDFDSINVVGGAFADRFVSDTTTISTSSDEVDISGVSVLLVNTSGGDVTIGGFTGGVIGQILYVIPSDASNNIIIEDDEGTGNQDIKTASSGDETITTDGGLTLIYGGGYWRGMGQ